MPIRHDYAADHTPGMPLVYQGSMASRFIGGMLIAAVLLAAFGFAGTQDYADQITEERDELARKVIDLQSRLDIATERACASATAIARQ